MKKILAILLSLLFILNAIGYYIAFKGAQYSIKKEIKKKIKENTPETELILIVLTKNEIRDHKDGFKFIEEKKEFRLKGKMYDIVRQHSVNDTFYFYCINDIQEEQLFANLEILVKSNTENNIPLKQKLNKLIKSFIKEALPKNKEQIWFKNFIEINFQHIDSFLCSISFEVLVPPPKTV